MIVRWTKLIILPALFGLALLFVAQLLPDEQVRAESTLQMEQPEIFCANKSTGQLCTHGSADTLKLTDSRREQWRQVAAEYNSAVEAATQKLLADTRSFLTPEERAEVESWFKALNPELNALLRRQTEIE